MEKNPTLSILNLFILNYSIKRYYGGASFSVIKKAIIRTPSQGTGEVGPRAARAMDARRQEVVRRAPALMMTAADPMPLAAAPTGTASRPDHPDRGDRSPGDSLIIEEITTDRAARPGART